MMPSFNSEHSLLNMVCVFLAIRSLRTSIPLTTREPIYLDYIRYLTISFLLYRPTAPVFSDMVSMSGLGSDLCLSWFADECQEAFVLCLVLLAIEICIVICHMRTV